MEPRPYQAEAFDAARKANVVMIGATGVGKVSKRYCLEYSRALLWRDLQVLVPLYVVLV